MDTAPLHEVAHRIKHDDLREALIRLLSFTTAMAAELDRIEGNKHPELPCPPTRPE